jgi:hypothetical protein
MTLRSHELECAHPVVGYPFRGFLDGGYAFHPHQADRKVAE